MYGPSAGLVRPQTADRRTAQQRAPALLPPADWCATSPHAASIKDGSPSSPAGYVGSPSFLTELHDLVLELKQVNPELIYRA